MLTMLLAATFAVALDPLQMVPREAQSVAVVRSADAVAQQLHDFCTLGHQRTLATLTEQLKERSRREFGADVLSPKDLTSLGLPAGSPFVLITMPRREAPVLGLPQASPSALSHGLRELIGGRYSRTALKAVEVAGVSLCALTVGDVVTPRVYWGHKGDNSYVAGPRGKEALADILASRGKPDWPEQQLLALADAQLVVLHREERPEHKAWHLGGLHMSHGQWRAMATLDPWEPKVAAPALSEALRFGREARAESLAQSLTAGALATAYGSNAGAVAVWADHAAQGNAVTWLGAPGAASWARLAQHSPALRQAFDGAALPFAWAAYEKSEAGASTPAHKRAELLFVAQGASIDEQTMLRRVVQRLQQRPSASATKVAMRAGKQAISLRLTQPKPGWDIVATDDMLVVTTHEFSQTSPLKVLEVWQAPHPLTGLGGPHPVDHKVAGARLFLPQLATAAAHMILAGAQTTLGSHPMAQAMPQLLMLGPTGDALRELGGLGTLVAEVQQRPSGVWGVVTVILPPATGAQGQRP